MWGGRVYCSWAGIAGRPGAEVYFMGRAGIDRLVILQHNKKCESTPVCAYNPLFIQHREEVRSRTTSARASVGPNV